MDARSSELLQINKQINLNNDDDNVPKKAEKQPKFDVAAVAKRVQEKRYICVRQHMERVSWHKYAIYYQLFLPIQTLSRPVRTYTLCATLGKHLLMDAAAGT